MNSTRINKYNKHNGVSYKLKRSDQFSIGFYMYLDSTDETLLSMYITSNNSFNCVNNISNNESNSSITVKSTLEYLVNFDSNGILSNNIANLNEEDEFRFLLSTPKESILFYNFYKNTKTEYNYVMTLNKKIDMYLDLDLINEFIRLDELNGIKNEFR